MARNPSSNRVEAEESTTGVEQGTVAGIDTPVETSTEQVAPASASSSSNGAQPAAGAAAASGDERFVFVNHPDTGAKTKRKDLILELWTQKKMSRSDIRKVLNEPNVRIGDKEIPYQIVFAATKGVPGGPTPSATPATAATETPAA